MLISKPSLIAIMLGRLHMSVADCKRWYMEIAKDAFTPTISRLNPINRWRAGAAFEVEKLEDAICKIVLSALPEGSELHNYPESILRGKSEPEPRDCLLKNPDKLEKSCRVYELSH